MQRLSAALSAISAELNFAIGNVPDGAGGDAIARARTIVDQCLSLCATLADAPATSYSEAAAPAPAADGDEFDRAMKEFKAKYGKQFMALAAKAMDDLASEPAWITNLLREPVPLPSPLPDFGSPTTDANPAAGPAL